MILRYKSKESETKWKNTIGILTLTYTTPTGISRHLQVRQHVANALSRRDHPPHTTYSKSMVEKFARALQNTTYEYRLYVRAATDKPGLTTSARP